jgi:hypothetical protein
VKKAAPKTRVREVVKRITVEQKTCLQCGKVFEGAKVAKFCSKACANNASYARHADEYRAARREKYRAEKKTVGKK